MRKFNKNKTKKLFLFQKFSFTLQRFLTKKGESNGFKRENY
jgi:hypothetical protein